MKKKGGSLANRCNFTTQMQTKDLGIYGIYLRPGSKFISCELDRKLFFFYWMMNHRLSKRLKF